MRKQIKVSKICKTALEGSIKKWHKIVIAFEEVEGTDLDPDYEENGPVNCPLCQRYHPSFTGNKAWRCSDACAIRKDTGKPFCDGTPYEAWSDEEEGETLENAKAMYDYLVDLNSRAVTTDRKAR